MHFMLSQLKYEAITDTVYSILPFLMKYNVFSMKNLVLDLTSMDFDC